MAVKPDQSTTRGVAGRRFDPFRDRVSRDIRNTLSEAFVAVWQGGDGDYAAVGDSLSRIHNQPVYQSYISRRLAAYRAAAEDRRGLDDPGLIEEVIVLWNRGLFFEVHELLEGHWHGARGVRREVLQTMIQAAAVYVHREAGREAAAVKLGPRVSARLDNLRSHLKAIANLDALVRELAAPQSRPPILRGNKH
jgi:hypothetical protein